MPYTSSKEIRCFKKGEKTLNKKSLVENRIVEFLNNSKFGNLGYISIKLNGKKINYFNVNNVDCKDGLQENITDDNANSILLANKVTVDGDYYGNSFTGFLIETLDFITE